MKPATLAGRLREYSTERLHSHDCYQFLSIGEGVSLLESARQRQPLYGKMCAFLPAGFLHRTLVVGRDIAFQSLYLPKDFIEHRSEMVVFELSALGTALLDRMIKDGTRGFGTEMGRECLNLFLRVASEDMAHLAFGMRLPTAKREESCRIIEFMERSYTRKIALPELRSILSCSVRHAARIFKAELGITPFEYLRLYRLFMASVRLQDPAVAILEVALGCGFASLSSFYSDFSRHFKTTPRMFRQRCTGGRLPEP